jgi:hypothetical protein
MVPLHRQEFPDNKLALRSQPSPVLPHKLLKTVVRFGVHLSSQPDPYCNRIAIAKPLMIPMRSMLVKDAVKRENKGGRRGM